MYNKTGFTLMEMLIVVAVIAILVAIAIPTFTGSLERTREAADQANLRTAYAQVLTDGMTNNMITPDNTEYITYNYNGDEYSASVQAQQSNADGWVEQGGKAVVTIGDVDNVTAVAKPNSWNLVFDSEKGTVSITKTK